MSFAIAVSPSRHVDHVRRCDSHESPRGVSASQGLGEQGREVSGIGGIQRVRRARAQP